METGQNGPRANSNESTRGTAGLLFGGRQPVGSNGGGGAPRRAKPDEERNTDLQLGGQISSGEIGYEEGNARNPAQVLKPGADFARLGAVVAVRQGHVGRDGTKSAQEQYYNQGCSKRVSREVQP